MARTFSYDAVDAVGGRTRGTLEAESDDEAVERVRRLGLRPIEVTERPAPLLGRELHLPGFGARAPKPADLAVAYRQLSTLVASGLPLLRCLSTVANQTEHAGLAEVFRLVAADIAAGDGLSVAMERRPEVFDGFTVAMVRAGEGSGDLDAALARLATALERAAELRRKIRSAMAYPVAIAAISGLLVLAMLVFLVPTFQSIFADLNGSLPLPTQVVILASKVLSRGLPVLVPATVIAVVVLRRWAATARGRRAIDAAKLRLPVMGALVHDVALARFASSLSTLSAAGLPILDALEIASRTAGNEVVREAVVAVADEVRTGRPLTDAMAEHAVFPPMLVQMVSVGEDTGALDLLLDKAAAFWDGEVASRVDALTTLIEPLLLVFMGVTVGGIVVALYLPMFKVITLIK